MLGLNPDELLYQTKYKVGDTVKVPGFHGPHRVVEVWRGKKTRYLLGSPVWDIGTDSYMEGVYHVNLVVEESRLEPPDYDSEINTIVP